MNILGLKNFYRLCFHLVQWDIRSDKTENERWTNYFLTVLFG